MAIIRSVWGTRALALPPQTREADLGPLQIRIYRTLSSYRVFICLSPYICFIIFSGPYFAGFTGQVLNFQLS
jgi:hypothetical protein